MSRDENESNRDKKVQGRARRRRHVQGTRAFTHAMTNRMAKEAARARDQLASGLPVDPSSLESHVDITEKSR